MTRSRLTQIWAPPLVIALVWLGAAWYPNGRSEDSVAEQLEELDRQRSIQIDRLASLRTLAAAGDELALRRQLLVETLPAESNLGVVLASFDAAAQTAGIQIDNLTPARADESESSATTTPLPAGVASITFRLTANGSYQSILDFVDGLTSMQRLLIVDGLSVFARAQDPNALNLTLNVRVFTSLSLSEQSLDTTVGPESLAFDERTGVSNDEQDLPPVLLWDPPFKQRNPFIRPTDPSDRELLHEDAPDGVPSSE